MRPRATFRYVFAVLALAGCAPKRVPAPAEQRLVLGEWSAPYRAWRQADMCFSDPALVKGELDAMSDLLSSLLGRTSASKEGMWADEHLALLEQAQKVLPPALDGYEAALAGLAGCELDPRTGLRDSLKKGELMARMARHRLEDAPALLDFVKAHRDAPAP